MMFAVIRLALVALAASALVAAEPSYAVLFRDDFSGVRGTPASSDRWIGESHAQGRGQFEGVGELAGDGQVQVVVRDRHPTEPGKFFQQNMRTLGKFLPADGQTLEFRARLKIPHQRTGLVSSMFLYDEARVDGVKRTNELDLEWLSNQTPGKSDDSVLLTSWADWNAGYPAYDVRDDPVHGTHASMTVGNGGATDQWRIYVMTWTANEVEWFVEDPDGTREYLGGQYGSEVVPDQAMYLHLNTWVPPTDWAAAHSDDLQLAAPDAATQTFAMVVDWIEVREVGVG